MIFEKFSNYLKEKEMISPEGKVIIALSGGIDSMVMLHLFRRFQEKNGGSIAVAHLNHGLRGEESDRDEEFVKKTAAQLGLDCFCKKVNLKKSGNRKEENIQSAGRRERYAFFHSVAVQVKADKIALGHNADDQAETVLMRIIRGSGINGIGGIPPIRGNIIRPILCLTRKEIEDYAKQEKVDYIEDSSNSSTKYLRNSIRLELMPLLRSYNPNIGQELNLLSNFSRDINSYLHDRAEDVLQKIKIGNKSDGDTLFLDLAGFNELPSALKGKLVPLAFEKITGTSSGLYSNHILQIEELALKGKSGTSIDLPDGIKTFIEYDSLVFAAERKEKILPFSLPLNLEGETILSQLDLTLTSKKVTYIDEREKDDKDIIFLDMEQIKEPLVVRNFRIGDRIKIKGMEGRKKLKNLYIDEKVPPRLRKKIPIIATGDEILWVVGLRHGEKAIANCHSKEILRVSKN